MYLESIPSSQLKVSNRSCDWILLETLILTFLVQLSFQKVITDNKIKNELLSYKEALRSHSHTRLADLIFKDSSLKEMDKIDSEYFENRRKKRELRLKTTILSPRTTTVQRGSSLNLQCVVQEHQKSPGKISWIINGTRLDFQTHRGGVNLEIMRQKKSTVSKLTIFDFREEDAGSYECRVEGLDPKNHHSSNEYQEILLSPSLRDSVEVRVVPLVRKEQYSSGLVFDRFSFWSHFLIVVFLNYFR